MATKRQRKCIVPQHRYEHINRFQQKEKKKQKKKKTNTQKTNLTLSDFCPKNWGHYNGAQALLAGLCCPYAIATDPKGNLYFNDGASRIRKINPLGIISTIAGGSSPGYSGDNGPAISAEVYDPYGMICDSIGNLFFSDTRNNCVRKIDTTGLITTIVGNATQGYSGDGSLAINAQLYGPHGLAFDANGNLYVSDAGNNVIRRVTNVGVMATGVKTSTGKIELPVFPNPANDELNILSSGTTVITLYNLLGEVVYRKNCEPGVNKVDVSEITDGLYLIRAKNKLGESTQKIIIQH